MQNIVQISARIREAAALVKAKRAAADAADNALEAAKVKNWEAQQAVGEANRAYLAVCGELEEAVGGLTRKEGRLVF